jgi:hypothetical protein
LGIKPTLSSKTAKKYQESIDLALLKSELDSDASSVHSLDLFSGLEKPISELQKQKGAPVNSDENSE